MAIPTHGMLGIYSNDGSTRLYYNGEIASGTSYIVNETGLMDRADTQVYTYTGNKKFIGFADVANATVPTYAIGDSTPSIVMLDILNLYIVEEEPTPPIKIKSPVIVIKQKVKQVVIDNANMTIDIYTKKVPATEATVTITNTSTSVRAIIYKDEFRGEELGVVGKNSSLTITIPIGTTLYITGHLDDAVMPTYICSSVTGDIVDNSSSRLYIINGNGTINGYARDDD